MKTFVTQYETSKVELKWILVDWRLSQEFIALQADRRLMEIQLKSPVIHLQERGTWQFIFVVTRVYGEPNDNVCIFVSQLLRCPSRDEPRLLDIIKGKGSFEMLEVSSHDRTVVKDGWFHREDIDMNFRIDDYLETIQSELSDLPESISFTADFVVFGTKRCNEEVTDHSQSIKPPVVPSVGLLGDFSKLLEDTQFTDVTIVVGDQKFYAHRAILITRSPVMKAMLSSDMLERQEAEIQMNDVSAEAWNIFQTFLYTERCPIPAPLVSDLLFELLMLSDKYDVPSMMPHLEAFVIEEMTPQNVLELVKVTEKFNTPIVKKAAEEMIRANWAVLKFRSSELVSSSQGLAASLMSRMRV